MSNKILRLAEEHLKLSYEVITRLVAFVRNWSEFPYDIWPKRLSGWHKLSFAIVELFATNSRLRGSLETSILQGPPAPPGELQVVTQSAIACISIKANRALFALDKPAHRLDTPMALERVV